MGVIIKESIKSSLISYFGVLIGFVNIGILQPRIITIEQIGYIGLITSYAELLAQLFSFGIPSMISKFFPWFEIEKKFKGIPPTHSN